jgi:hypothetical protein
LLITKLLWTPFPVRGRGVLAGRLRGNKLFCGKKENVDVVLYPWPEQIAEAENLGEVELGVDRERIGLPHQARSSTQVHIGYSLKEGYGPLSSRLRNNLMK